MANIFRLNMLPAGHGDSLWIDYGDQLNPHHILIDGGYAATYDEIAKKIRALPEDRRHIELLVITHIDNDHIKGILKLLSRAELNVTFGDIWFNAWRHLPDSEFESFGPLEGEKLSTLLSQGGMPWNTMFDNKSVSLQDDRLLPTVQLPGGMKLTILSPREQELKELVSVWAEKCREAGLDPNKSLREEPPVEPPTGYEVMGPPDVEALAATPFKKNDSEANGSSIAFIARFARRSVLMAADGFADVLLDGIKLLVPDKNKSLSLDAFKIPHHGSRGNINQELLEKVDCGRYLFSTNSGKYDHPDMEAVARVIKYGGAKPELIFNYKTAHTTIWNSQGLIRRHNYSVKYPEPGQEGVTIDI